MDQTERTRFDEWVVLELMGHRRLAGKLTEQEIAGAPFLRLDVPGAEGNAATQFYAPAAVYCITPVSEEIARAIAARSQPEPVYRWELPARTDAFANPGTEEDDSEEDDDQ